MSDKKNPWELEGVPWKNESQFMNFVRGVLRKGWSRHPVKLEYVKRNRIKVPNPNPNGRVEKVWGMECNMCKGYFPMPVDRKTRARIEDATGEKLVVIEINHINEAGAMTSKEDIGRYAANLLFVNFEDLEPLCQECHSIVSYSQKEKVSIEEARVQKKVIQIIKEKRVNEVLEGLGIKPESNSKKRRKQLVDAFMKETK